MRSIGKFRNRVASCSTPQTFVKLDLFKIRENLAIHASSWINLWKMLSRCTHPSNKLPTPTGEKNWCHVAHRYVCFRVRRLQKWRYFREKFNDRSSRPNFLAKAGKNYLEIRRRVEKKLTNRITSLPRARKNTSKRITIITSNIRHKLITELYNLTKIVLWVIFFPRCFNV